MPGKNRDPIFVVGAARSGTTLLRLILDAHSDLAVCGELHFYDQISQFRRWAPILQDERDLRLVERWVKRTVALRLMESGRAILKRALDRLRAKLPCEWSELHRSLMQAYADVSDRPKARLGEKTPANVRYMSEILRSFPNAKFIHLVRDPRAVAASSIDVPGNSNDVLIHTLTWRCDVFSAREFAMKSSPGVVTEVRYEDLVRAPVRELRRLTNFLDIPFEEKMLRFHSDAGDSLATEEEPWKTGAGQPIYQSSIDRWKKRLNPAQIRLVELAAGDFPSRYNYRPFQDAEGSTLSLPRGLAVAGKRYLTAKVDSRSLLPEEEGDEEYVDSDTTILVGLLVRSMIERHLV